jgi:hypothetical protein
MRNLGIVLLALIALFMGGCSLVASYDLLRFYGAGLLVMTLPFLFVALLLGWWAWRIYKR